MGNLRGIFLVGKSSIPLTNSNGRFISLGVILFQASFHRECGGQIVDGLAPDSGGPTAEFFSSSLWIELDAREEPLGHGCLVSTGTILFSGFVIWRCCSAPEILLSWATQRKLLFSPSLFWYLSFQKQDLAFSFAKVLEKGQKFFLFTKLRLFARFFVERREPASTSKKGKQTSATSVNLFYLHNN